MKPSKVLERLLKTFYREYCDNEVVRQYGWYAWELTDVSGIDFGDAGDAWAAVNRMRERGWIRIRARTTSIQLTEEGIRYAELLMRPWYHRHVRDGFVAFVEGVTRGLSKR